MLTFAEFKFECTFDEYLCQRVNKFLLDYTYLQIISVTKLLQLYVTEMDALKETCSYSLLSLTGSILSLAKIQIKTIVI